MADLTERPLRVDKKFFKKYNLQKPGEEPIEFSDDGDSFWLPMR